MQKFNSEILAIARGSRGLSQSDLAELMKWSQGKASKVEHGLIQLEADEVQRLAETLKYPVALFYMDDSIRGFGSCCLYHRKKASTSVRALNQLHDTLNIRRIQLTRLIKGVSLPHEPNFPQLDIDQYGDPEHIAQMLRAAWSLPRGPITNLVDVVEAAGGIVVPMDLGTPKIDAVSQRARGLPPLFFVDPGKPTDRSRYTLAHEIGHIVMHTAPSASAEEEADRFAAEFLMPAKEIGFEVKDITVAKAAAMKLRWRVSMQALIRRAKDTGGISAAKYQSLCVRIGQLGYRTNEPNALNPERPQMLRQLFDLYTSERGYSVAELSAAVLCNEDEFKALYLTKDAVPKLRVVK